jgi:hypothetical protein
MKMKMNLRIVWVLVASMVGYKIQMSMSIALAPVTLGEVVYGASHLSNTLRVSVLRCLEMRTESIGV